MNSFSIHYDISTLTNTSQPLCPLVFIAILGCKYTLYSQHNCDRLSEYILSFTYSINHMFKKSSRMCSFCWVILHADRNAVKCREYNFMENQNFKARSDHKEYLLQWFAHLADNRMFWEAFLKKIWFGTTNSSQFPSVGSEWGLGL